MGKRTTRPSDWTISKRVYHQSPTPSMELEAAVSVLRVLQVHRHAILITPHRESHANVVRLVYLAIPDREMHEYVEHIKRTGKPNITGRILMVHPSTRSGKPRSRLRSEDVTDNGIDLARDTLVWRRRPDLPQVRAFLLRYVDVPMTVEGGGLLRQIASNLGIGWLRFQRNELGSDGWEEV